MAATDPPLLSLSHISKSFYGIKVLDDINFTLHEGEGHCLAGENGSGKSTLIKIISGTYTPDAGGTIAINGNPVPAMTPSLAHQFGIQVIFQDLALFPNLTIAQNIAISEYVDSGLRAVRTKRVKSSAQGVLDKLGISLPLDEKVGDISMAKRQIVAIARALTKPAKILFMDEPTASLTYHEAQALLAIVGELKRQGLCVVFVSHRLDELMSVADNVTVLRNGAKVITAPASTLTSKDIARHMTGKEIITEQHRRTDASGDVVLSVRDLTKKPQYEHISFDLHKHEVIGIIGLLGSGRTELALSLFGMNRPESGAMLLNGEAYNPKNNRDAIGRGLVYLSEDRLNLGLIQDQSIDKNLSLASLKSLKNRAGFLDLKKAAEFCGGWLSKLGVKYSKESAPIKTLSGGNQQKVAIAKWLATDPQVLILDSPTVGVDVGARDTIYEIINSCAKDKLAIILISDELEEVYYNCSRILHISNGLIAAQYSTLEMSEAQIREKINAAIA